MKTFSQRCIELLKKIPKGKVTTYAALANVAGNYKGSRAAGNAMNCNLDPDGFPCYKVVKSDGTLGGYAFGVKEKIRRLEKDGIEIKNGKIDLKKFGYFF